MKALIFNSGLGTRMKDMTEDKPKCMIKLYNGESIFERQIRILNECGITNIIVTTGPYEDMLKKISNQYPNISFTFVPNKEYKTTNYIVSMNNAYNYLDEDILLLHGDLVFNKELVKKILKNKHKSVCLYNEEKQLPEKDFKGRIENNKLREVSINIFDNNCHAFQPLYKLSRHTLKKWKEKVKEYVDNGITKVYAENALNEILHKLSIVGMSYKNDYIEEIDNQEDYERVNKEIELFDKNA